MKNNYKEYKFVILFLVVEGGLEILFSFSGLGGFSLTPYMRLSLILFTALFFSLDILKIKIPRKVKGFVFPYKNIFAFGWLFFAIIALFIGLLNSNPILYLITDFIYIFFGVGLFYITERRTGNDITNRFFLIFSRLLASLAFIYFFLSFKPPALLLILMVVLIYIHILKARILDILFLLIPYLFLVVSTNRSQLIIFLLMIFIFFLKKFRHYFAKKVVLFFGLGIAVILFFLKHQILNGILFFVNPNSNIGFRINQIAVILREGIDYSSPYLTSISQRVVEAKIVVGYWTKNLATFVFGLGSGATIDGSKFYNDETVLNSALLGENNIHNIHLLPFALIFRYGLIGLLFFCLLLLMTYKSFIKVLNEDKDVHKIFWNLFFIFWFFFSIPASSFLWSMPVFWISLSMINKKNNQLL